MSLYVRMAHYPPICIGAYMSLWYITNPIWVGLSVGGTLCGWDLCGWTLVYFAYIIILPMGHIVSSWSRGYSRPIDFIVPSVYIDLCPHGFLNQTTVFLQLRESARYNNCRKTDRWGLFVTTPWSLFVHQLFAVYIFTKLMRCKARF